MASGVGPVGNRLRGMSSWCRALLAVLVTGAVLLLAPPGLARAESPSPTSSPAATATASPGAEAGDDSEPEDSPDVAPDNTRTVIALAGAGVLALIAASVVFLRR